MCGLFGFIGLKKKPIDFTTFLSLGCENDSRGGDGCGIFLDGEVEYLDVKKKYFSNFYDDSNLLKKHNDAQILIGHDRKASVGGVTNEKLQPVVIYNERDEIDFVLMHNGTLVNHKELAEKYLSMSEEESKKFSDSQILARIIYLHGFKVLSEYIGAAALIMIDYRTVKRKPAVYMFKGESKTYKSSVNTEEERPLCFVRVEDGLWFSSTDDYFNIFTFKTDKDIYDFPTNQVILLNHNDKLILIENVDRSQMYQKETTVNTSSSYSSSNYTMAYEYPYGSYTDCSFDFEDSKTPTVPKLPESTTDKHKFARESFRYIDSKTKEPLNGVIYVYSDGTYEMETTCSNRDNAELVLYFFNGILLKGENALCLMYFLMDNAECSEDELILMYGEFIYPIAYVPKIGDDKKLYTYTTDGKLLEKNGKLDMLNLCGNQISTIHYTIQNGRIRTSLYDASIKSFKESYEKACTEGDELSTYLFNTFDLA